MEGNSKHTNPKCDKDQNQNETLGTQDKKKEKQRHILRYLAAPRPHLQVSPPGILDCTRPEDTRTQVEERPRRSIRRTKKIEEEVEEVHQDLADDLWACVLGSSDLTSSDLMNRLWMRDVAVSTPHKLCPDTSSIKEVGQEHVQISESA